MSQLKITYRVSGPAAEIEARADALLLEQSVELPRPVVKDPWVLENIVGEVQSIEKAEEDLHRVTVLHPWITTASDPAQLLNVLFGNSSLQPDVLLEDIELPEEAWSVLPGPNVGIEGVRKLTGAQKRPITGTALKPMGLSVEKLASLCATFTEAGIDLIKDDHGLANHAFCPFEDRVKACQEAVQEANSKHGQQSLYIPNLIGTPDTILRQLDFSLQQGIKMVMLSPMMVGMGLMPQIARQHPELSIMAHPAFGGAVRIDPVAHLGKLFRWFGADIVIYPNYGGRFQYSKDTCKRLADVLTQPKDPLRNALPAPAGGMKVERVPELVDFYGSEMVSIVGGSIFETETGVLDRAKAFVNAIAASAPTNA